jgi:hypothetical protein
MRTSRRTYRAVHAVAAAALAFYLLAAGRALVPGLCSTLAAVEETNTAVICCASHTSNTAGPVITTPEPAHADCAFCALAHALWVPVTHVIIEPGVVPAEYTPAAYAAPFVAHDDASSISRRGPPAAV